MATADSLSTDLRAALDIGSNTIRLLIARVSSEGIETVLDRSAFARLGLGVDATQMLRNDRMDEALEAIRRFAEDARGFGIEDIPAVATSAIRDAHNGSSFVDRVRETTGISVEIVTGQREAELTFLGATSTYGPDEDLVVVDLGGGSTEIVAGSAGKPTNSTSLQLGAGRLTERYITQDPPPRGELDTIRAAVTSAIEKADLRIQPDTVIFTGGTASHLAQIGDLGSPPAPVSVEDALRALDVLCAAPAGEIAARYELPLERARVLPAGVAAITSILQYFGAAQAVISHAGLREGVIMDRLRRTGDCVPDSAASDQ